MKTFVSVIMGSRSDWQTMKYVSKTLASMAITHEARIMSVSRTSDQIEKYARSAEERGVELIVASARGAVDLPGILASKTDIPVLAVPYGPTSMNDEDLRSTTAKTPVEQPVGVLAVGRAGAVTTAVEAANMLANDHEEIRMALAEYHEQ